MAGSPDFQVVARHEAGGENSELSEAIARALVASGGRVVLGGPSGQPCARCVHVTVTHRPKARHRIEVTRDGKRSISEIHLPGNAALLDQARALVVQIRLLVPSADEITPVPLVTRGQRTNVEANPVANRLPRKQVPETATDAPESLPTPVASAASERLAPGSKPPTSSPLEGTMAPSPGEPAEPPLFVEKAPLPDPSRERTRSRWPYLSIALGSAAAISSGICAYLARDRYHALADRSQSLFEARQLKHEGESLQIASVALAGVAVVGVTAGLWGLGRGRGGQPSFQPVVQWFPDGAFVAVRRDLP